MRDQDKATLAEFNRLDMQRWDADSRTKLRKLAEDRFGLLTHVRIIDAQIGYLTTAQSGSATDNELALLYWGTYPRNQWIINPLHYGLPAPSHRRMMVMRLDGPNPADVQHIIRTSAAVEITGLTGVVAIDARGIAPTNAKGQPDPFGVYDEKLRRLADILQQKTTLKVVLDNHPEVFAPHSVNDVALYVGWYSLNNYVPGCNFNSGAVGYHIASFEMVKLHGQVSGWVHGLIGSGCVGTLGPVAEPYLHAFPSPEDFFPLLLTGKLTLAEVYWKTEPTASWMISFIGDPLYTPYKVNPAMKPEDLSPALRTALDGD